MSATALLMLLALGSVVFLKEELRFGGVVGGKDSKDRKTLRETMGWRRRRPGRS